MYIKVRYMHDGTPFGKEYVFESPFKVNIGDIVFINIKTTAVVTDINVPESDVEHMKDKIKKIIGKWESDR